jgi:hypothetical protein
VWTDGVPNGTLYAAEKNAFELPPFNKRPRFRTFAFSRPAVLSAGTEYAIVLAASGTCDVYQGPAGDSYSRGSALVTTGWDGPWAPAGSHDDLAFQTQGFMRLVAGDDHGHVTRLVPPLSPDDPDA